MADDVVERVALALLNERQGYFGSPTFDTLEGLEPHRYRDQLRYARAAIAALASRPVVGESLIEQLKLILARSLMNANAGVKWLDDDSMDEMIEAAWVGFEEPARAAYAALSTPSNQAELPEWLNDLADHCEKTDGWRSAAGNLRAAASALSPNADLITKLCTQDWGPYSDQLYGILGECDG